MNENLLKQNKLSRTHDRGELLPEWMRVMAALMVFFSVVIFIAWVFDNNRQETGYFTTFQQTSNVLMRLNLILCGLAAWSLIREKQQAVTFCLITSALCLISLLSFFGTIIRTHAILQWSTFLNLFLSGILMLFMARLWKIRKEWKACKRIIE